MSPAHLACTLLAAAAVAVPARTAHRPHAPGPTYVIAGGKGTATLLLGPKLQGAREAALTLLQLAPGAEVPEHVHESSAEMLYIEAGRVEMTIAGRTTRAGPGDAVYIPAGTPHAARVLGPAESVRAVQVYVAPGPEQRFSKGEKLP